MSNSPSGRTARGLGLKLALVGGGIAAGVVVATALGANAATSGSGTTAPPSASQPTGRPGAPAPGDHDRGDHDRGRFDHGGAAPVRGDENSLGTSLTARLKAAALKAVPGGSVYRIETDSGDGTYEAHMTRSDGSLATVKFDKTGAVTSVEQGMGR